MTGARPRWLSLLCLAWVGVGSSTVAWAAGPCGCNDVPHLQARFCMARAAVEEWDRLIEWTKARETKDGKVEMLDEDAREEVRGCANEIITVHRKAFHGTGPATSPIDIPVARANTDTSCKATIDAPTACLRDVLARHEKEHEEICRAKSAPDADWRKNADLDFIRSLKAKYIDWRYSQSLVDYMVEERHSYAHEMVDIENRLNELHQSGKCPAAMFELQGRPEGMRFSLTPCPRPDLKDWDPRQCKRM